MSNLKNLTLREAFELYASKAPVQYPGPQRIANAAYKIIEPHLYSREKSILATWVSHCKMEPGRKDVDDVISNIRNRLFYGIDWVGTKPLEYRCVAEE